MDELRSIAVFAKAIELGSFRAAAKAFDLSPSVVSYHISQLEERYEVALIYRSTRKLSLTAEGQRLYEHASVVSSAAEKCLNVLAQESTEPCGKLSISAPAVLIHSSFTEKLATFAKQYSKVDLEINYTDLRQDLIAEGIDVAIRVGHMPDSNLKAKSLGAIKRKLVCSRDYYDAKPEPKSPKDLNDWKWVELSMLPASRTFRNEEGSIVESINHSSVSVNSVSATCQFSIYGLGLSSPPDFMVDKPISQGRLVHVLPDWVMDDIPVYAVWPGNVKRGSLASIFIAYLADSDIKY